MVATLSPARLSELLSNPNARLIDVRDHHEWAGGHIEGSRSLLLEELRTDPERELPKDAVLIFVCAKGARSLTAAKWWSGSAIRASTMSRAAWPV